MSMTLRVLVAFRIPRHGRRHGGIVVLTLIMGLVAALLLTALTSTVDTTAIVQGLIGAASVVGAAALLTSAMAAWPIGIVAATNLCLIAFVALSMTVPPIFTYGYPAPSALESASAFFRGKDAVTAGLLTLLPVLDAIEDLTSR